MGWIQSQDKQRQAALNNIPALRPVWWHWEVDRLFDIWTLTWCNTKPCDAAINCGHLKPISAYVQLFASTCCIPVACGHTTYWLNWSSFDTLVDKNVTSLFRKDKDCLTSLHAGWAKFISQADFYVEGAKYPKISSVSFGLAPHIYLSFWNEVSIIQCITGY